MIVVVWKGEVIAVTSHRIYIMTVEIVLLSLDVLMFSS